MRSRKLIIALVVLVAIIAFIAAQRNAEQLADGAHTGSDLPTLSVDRAAVDGLEISVPGRATVVLARADEQWRVESPLSASASKAAVDTALDKLSELSVVGIAATKESNHSKLDVTPDKGIHVLVKGGGQTLADLWIGSYRSGNTMVRKTDAEQVLSVEGSIRYAFDKELKDFRDRTVTELPLAQVERVRFESDKGSVSLVQEAGAFKQAEGDKPIKDFDAQKAKAAVTSAVRLSAVDFAPTDVTAERAGLTAQAATVTLVLAGDAGPNQVVLRVGQKAGDKVYLQREGRDVIYLVSDFVGTRLRSTASDFVADPTPPPDAEGAQPPHPVFPSPGH